MKRFTSGALVLALALCLSGAAYAGGHYRSYGCNSYSGCYSNGRVGCSYGCQNCYPGYGCSGYGCSSCPIYGCYSSYQPSYGYNSYSYQPSSGYSLSSYYGYSPYGGY